MTTLFVGFARVACWYNTVFCASDPTPQAKEIMYHKANLNRIIADYTVSKEAVGAQSPGHF